MAIEISINFTELKILHLSRISKKTFYHNYFTQNVCNMKKTWEGINASISHKKSNKVILVLFY